MRALEHLNISRNQMLVVPDGFGQLRRLQTFVARCNRFVIMPDFEGCDALRTIDMRENSIAQLSAEFCEQLPQLEQLQLAGNRMARLPDEIYHLPKLEVLDVAGNKLFALPLSLTLMPSLRTLLLHDNPIRTLPNGITRQSLALVMEALRSSAEKDGKSGWLNGTQAPMKATRPADMQMPDK